jgi:hypothetical protein
MSTTPSTDGVVHFRVRAELLDQLREIAAREDRSLSGEVRKAIAEHVERASTGTEDETP